MLLGRHDSARPRGLWQPVKVPLTRGQSPPPILAFWEASFLPNPSSLHLALPKCNEEDEDHWNENSDYGLPHGITLCFTCSSSNARQKEGQNTQACWRYIKIKKQQAEVFCCTTGHTAVCLVLLFSINTDMKKLNKYKRWSNAIDKERADILSSLQQYIP